MAELWFHIATESYPEYAGSLLDRLYAHFELLRLNPGMGSHREGIGGDVCLFPVEKINVIYRLDGEDLIILRVHHSALDSNTLRL